jgi:acyl dehydratase
MAEIDRSLLGQWGPETRMHVELGKIREFARAVKDDDPRFADEACAVAPPTFLMTIAHWIDPTKSRPGIRLDYRRLLHGEQEFEYLAPIRPGDVLTARSRTNDVFEKEGRRGGTMLFVVSETEYRNQQGAVVAYARNVAIQTAGPVAG